MTSARAAPPFASKPYTCAMPGSLSCARSFASRSKRDIRSASFVRFSGSTLSATCRSRRESFALPHDHEVAVEVVRDLGVRLVPEEVLVRPQVARERGAVAIEAAVVD